MIGLDSISLLIGALISIAVGVLIFFLTRIFFFKTKIYWPESFNQDNRSYFFSLNDKIYWTSSLKTFFKVEGWEPARDVKITFEGAPEDITITPNIPFMFNNERKQLEFDAINSGVYEVAIIKKLNNEMNQILIKGISSSNATCSTKSLVKSRFKNIWDVLMFPICFSTLLIFIAFVGKTLGEYSV